MIIIAILLVVVIIGLISIEAILKKRLKNEEEIISRLNIIIDEMRKTNEKE